VSPRPAFARRAVALLALGAIGLLLAGCATHRPQPTASPALAPPVDAPDAFAAQSAREAFLAETGDWRLRGRVAFANGREGATVQIDWTQRGDVFDIRLVAPITGREWRLSGRPGAAELLGLEGGPRRAEDAEGLLFETTGWRLPVRHFPYWVRGARGPEAAAAVQVDAEGRPVSWTQSGWALSFRDWWPGEPPLPRRVFATREDASVRLVVAEWAAVAE
jgi:outer membrane lipoprotein LolB